MRHYEGIEDGQRVKFNFADRESGPADGCEEKYRFKGWSVPGR